MRLIDYKALTKVLTKVLMLESCQSCTLSGPCVWGEASSLDPDVMLIGEAPGEMEIRLGRPFVGRSGQILRGLVDQAGLTSVYYTNLVARRPPGNRDPSPLEINLCRARLQEEMDAVKPIVVVTLGRLAANQALGNGSMSKLNGRWGTWKGYPCVATWHPAAALHNPRLRESIFTEILAVLLQVKSYIAKVS